MIRKTVDQLGRIVLPAEYRRELHIESGEEIGITISANQIIIKKAGLGCDFCNSEETLAPIGNLHACRSCIERLRNII